MFYSEIIIGTYILQ